MNIIPGLASDLRSVETGKAEKAFEKIYKSYQPALQHIAVNILKDTAEAEEVVNDTFVKLWDNRADMTGNQHIHGWLVVALRNACFTALKRLKREKRIPVTVQDDFEQAAILQFLQRSDLYRRVLQFAEQLPRQTRDVYLLYLQGKTNAEIADELGINYNVAKAQASRARQIIKDKFVKSPDKDAFLMVLFICFVGSTYSA